MGHHVRIAYTGSEALQTVKTLRPQVVLLDIGLPGMSGYDVAKRLRGMTNLDATVLVAMTGYGQEEDKQRCRDVGFDHHIVKPVDPKVLKGLLESLKSTKY